MSGFSSVCRSRKLKPLFNTPSLQSQGGRYERGAAEDEECLRVVGEDMIICGGVCLSQRINKDKSQHAPSFASSRDQQEREGDEGESLTLKPRRNRRKTKSLMLRLCHFVCFNYSSADVADIQDAMESRGGWRLSYCGSEATTQEE